VIRAALLLILLAALAGCASYSVEPFYDTVSKQVLCCRATAWSAKDVGTLNFFATERGGAFVVRFAETGVKASAPIAAAAIAASDVSAAVIGATGAIVKLAP